MNRSFAAAAALVAGIAIATPMLAWSADNPPQAPQAAPAQPGMTGAMPGMGSMPGMDGMQGMMGDRRGMMEGMGHGGWMRERMMHRMMQLSPQQRCQERLARRAGMIAYTIAKLNLTAQQRPLWDKLQSVMQTAGDRERQLCASLPSSAGRGEETVLDRVNRREQFLTARLQGLHEVRPALEQLYQALTPEQKAIVNHPFRPG
jgi:LTXXQ motif family protein